MDTIYAIENSPGSISGGLINIVSGSGLVQQPLQEPVTKKCSTTGGVLGHSQANAAPSKI